MFGCEISVAFLSGQTESVHGVRLMVTVMMPVDILENLARDAEESANFVHRGATLRLPSDGGVPQRVRCHVLAEPRRLHNGPEALVDPFNGSRLPLDQEGCTSTRDGVDRVAGNGPADPIWPSVNWRCLRWLPRRRRQHGLARRDSGWLRRRR